MKQNITKEGVSLKRVAVFSSASENISEENKESALAIGSQLAKNGHRTVTGGCVGLPSYSIQGALLNGGKTVGYFPDRNLESYTETKNQYNSDEVEHYHERRFYEGFSNRNLHMINNIDAAIILNGRIGTLSEVTMAIEENIPVYILKNSGGISDELEYILDLVNRSYTDSQIFFSESIEEIIGMINRK